MKNFGGLTHLFILFFNVITNTPEMTSGEKKNFPAARSYTQDSPHPTMTKVTDYLITSIKPAKPLLDVQRFLPIIGEV